MDSLSPWFIIVFVGVVVLYYVISKFEDSLSDNDGYIDESYKPVENIDVLWDELQSIINEDPYVSDKESNIFVKCEYCGTVNKKDQLRCYSCNAPLIKL